MRALSPDERWALDIVAGPKALYKTNEPDGAKLEAMMRVLIKRGCVTYRVDGPNLVAFALTELGVLARRVSVPGAPPL